MTIKSPVAVAEWLRTNGDLSESLVKEFAFERFGYDVKIVLEQVIDADRVLLTPSRLVTIRMQAVQEVHFIGALGALMVDYPEEINWGLSEVATVRLEPTGECCRLVLAWEDDRRATVTAHRVELETPEDHNG